MNENETAVCTELDGELCESEQPGEAVTENCEPEAAAPDDFELICARERADREYDEFARLFPEMSLNELPDGVLENVRSGIPLCAACALYERRRAFAFADAARANEENREKAIILRSRTGGDGYLSAEEVKGMSAAEVRANYKKIIESMNHWN